MLQSGCVSAQSGCSLTPTGSFAGQETTCLVAHWVCLGERELRLSAKVFCSSFAIACRATSGVCNARFEGAPAKPGEP